MNELIELFKEKIALTDSQQKNLSNRLTHYLLTKINDEISQSYFLRKAESINRPSVLENLRELFLNAQKNIERSSIIPDDNKHKIIQTLKNTSDLNLTFIKDKEIPVLQVNPKSINFIFFLVIFYFLNYQDVHKDLPNVFKQFLFLTYAYLLAFIIPCIIHFYHKAAKGIPLIEFADPNTPSLQQITKRIFDIDNFIDKYKGLKKPITTRPFEISHLNSSEAKGSETGPKIIKIDGLKSTSSTMNATMGISYESSTESLNIPAKHADLPKIEVKKYSKLTVFFRKKTSVLKPIEKLTITFIYRKQNYEFELMKAAVYPLKKGNKTTPLVEDKYFIYYDNSDMTREEDYKFKTTAREAIFYPGSAKGKNCIHYLGNGIYSIKCKSDYRVLGTVVATTEDGKKLIYLWKVVQHDEQKRLLRNKNSLQQELEYPPTLEKGLRPSLT